MPQLREEGPAILPDSGDIRLPDPPGANAGQEASDTTRSLVDDIEELILDAKTYFDAELSYQKSRASFVGNALKRTVAFAVVAAVLALFAFGGLVVGLIIALTPLITAWGATAVVVGALLLLAYLLVSKAAESWGEMMAAIHEDSPEDKDGN